MSLRNPTGIDWGFPYTVDPGIVRGSDTTLTLAVGGASSAVYQRVREGGTISKIGLRVGTASGNISVAAYANSGAGRSAVPGTRYATSGAVACPVTGYAEIALGSTVTLQPGDWLGLSADNTTVSFQAQLANAILSDLGKGRQYLQYPSAHPLPSGPASLAATIGHTFVLVGVA